MKCLSRSCCFWVDHDHQISMVAAMHHELHLVAHLGQGVRDTALVGFGPGSVADSIALILEEQDDPLRIRLDSCSGADVAQRA